jgi:hypothetical protein
MRFRQQLGMMEEDDRNLLLFLAQKMKTNRKRVSKSRTTA